MTVATVLAAAKRKVPKYHAASECTYHPELVVPPQTSGLCSYEVVETNVAMFCHQSALFLSTQRMEVAAAHLRGLMP
jgi:hypothetical protein